MSDAARTRLSFTHERAELRGQNPLYAKTHPVPFNDSANDSKEDRRAAFKSKRRDETMVERDRPYPELKPSPELASSVDRQMHSLALADERKEARRQAFHAARRDNGPKLETNRNR